MNHRVVRAAAVVVCAVAAYQAFPAAQDRLRSMPGYAQYEKVSRELPGAVKSGALTGAWKDASTFEYARDGKLCAHLPPTDADAHPCAGPTTGSRQVRGR